VFCYYHTEVLTWRHLNVFQHRCEITCRLPRGKCRQCGHLFRVRPPWEGLSTHFTKEFEAFAILLMRETPTTSRIVLVFVVVGILLLWLFLNVAFCAPRGDLRCFEVAWTLIASFLGCAVLTFVFMLWNSASKMAKCGKRRKQENP
jgi:hypothetical protein